MDLLKRGWSPSTRTRAVVRVGVALLLVLNPVWIDVLHLDSTSVRYDVRDVNVSESGRALVVATPDGDDRVPIRGFDGVACDGIRERTTACAVEEQLLEAGYYPATVRAFINHGGYVLHQGRLYERELTLANDTVDIVPAEPSTVRDDIARDADDLPLRLRLALLTGSIETDEPIAEGAMVVETDDGFVAFVQVGSSSSNDGRDREAMFSTILVLVGAGLVWRLVRSGAYAVD